MYFYVVPKTMAETVFDDFLSYNAMNIIFKASALTIQSFEKENSHFFGFSGHCAVKTVKNDPLTS